ncbi:MAG TPA: hypothetical protein VFV38_43870 [Ktedonobacteraceae bacterium]|nr:hypothetical protein [Ktedonobacteraceae bacterium]
MSQTNSSSNLLGSTSPGAWIAEHRHIWQMDFLNANKFANFSSSRGLAYFNEEDIIQLWQVGLVKADLIVSRRKFKRAGLIDRGTDLYGSHLYSDERKIHQRSSGWANARKVLKPIQPGVELFFHPFRYYVLYFLSRGLKLNASPIMMFHQEGYPRILDICLSLFNTWSRSQQFISSIEKWNDITALAILTDPWMYQRVFRSVRFSYQNVTSIDTGVEEMLGQIAHYSSDIEKLYRQIGQERLEEIHQDLCVATQMLDSNRWVHTLLCLGQGKFRLESEGHLGGALLLRTMAEMLRRGTEKTFSIQMREEDERGFGWMPENVKKELYGSNRIVDGDEGVAREFLRQYGLHYGLRLRFYVEGPTEAEALRYVFQTSGAQYIEVINLAGEVAQKRGKGVAFRENLRSDIAMHVFSMVLIDGDRNDFVSSVKKAAKDDEICGRFFISEQDFEFANFELSELEEILWEWAIEEDKEKTLLEEDRCRLHEAIKDSPNAEELIKRSRKILIPLNTIAKGERWGRKLIDFAGNHPTKEGKQRPIVEAVQAAIMVKKAKYKVTRCNYKVDENTGQLVKRDKPIC